MQTAEILAFIKPQIYFAAPHTVGQISTAEAANPSTVPTGQHYLFSYIVDGSL